MALFEMRLPLFAPPVDVWMRILPPAVVVVAVGDGVGFGGRVGGDFGHVARAVHAGVFVSQQGALRSEGIDPLEPGRVAPASRGAARRPGVLLVPDVSAFEHRRPGP